MRTNTRPAPVWLAMTLGLAVLQTTVAAPQEGAEPTRFIIPLIDDDAETTWRKLAWHDFRRDLSSWRREAAGIASQVAVRGMRLRSRPTSDESGFVASIEAIEVFAIMSKLESGYKPGGRSPAILAHEQLHFDLTEVCARRLRKKLVELEGRGSSQQTATRNLRSAIEALHGEAVTNCSALQALYDEETRHGLNRRQQKR